MIKTAWGNDYEWDWLFNVSEGSYDKDLDRMPCPAFEWKEGQSMAFIVDFLDAHTETLPSASITKMRPARSDKGFIPTEVLNEKPVDMAILTVANFDQISNDRKTIPRHDSRLPGGIVANLQASHYVFRSLGKLFWQHGDLPWPFNNVTILPLSVVPLTNAQFLERLKNATQAPFTFRNRARR